MNDIVQFKYNYSNAQKSRSNYFGVVVGPPKDPKNQNQEMISVRYEISTPKNKVGLGWNLVFCPLPCNKESKSKVLIEDVHKKDLDFEDYSQKKKELKKDPNGSKKKFRFQLPNGFRLGEIVYLAKSISKNDCEVIEESPDAAIAAATVGEKKTPDNGAAKAKSGGGCCALISQVRTAKKVQTSALSANDAGSEPQQRSEQNADANSSPKDPSSKENWKFIPRGFRGKIIGFEPWKKNIEKLPRVLVSFSPLEEGTDTVTELKNFGSEEETRERKEERFEREGAFQNVLDKTMVVNVDLGILSMDKPKVEWKVQGSKYGWTNGHAKPNSPILWEIGETVYRFSGNQDSKAPEDNVKGIILGLCRGPISTPEKYDNSCSVLFGDDDPKDVDTADLGKLSKIRWEIFQLEKERKKETSEKENIGYVFNRALGVGIILVSILSSEFFHSSKSKQCTDRSNKSNFD